MSAATDRPIGNDCGCCEGVSAETPAVVTNRPGLPALAYRVGTYQQFLESMLARISQSRLPGLAKLTTRDRTDFTIAFLDACAMVGDILTFYEERAINETYLRTATERLSVQELAKLIDYQLRPGVAASAWLAFTLDDAPGALGQALSLTATAHDSIQRLPPIVIDAGLKVQSVPAPGEQAQTYETVEPIQARIEWNGLTPRVAQLQTIDVSRTFAYLDGLEHNVKPGDITAVIDGAGQKQLKTILGVTLDTDRQLTRVDFGAPGPLPAEAPPAAPIADIADFSAKMELDDDAIETIVTHSWASADLEALAAIQGWPLEALAAAIARRLDRRDASSTAGIFVFRQRSATFGHNAPAYNSLPPGLQVAQRVEKFKIDNGSVVSDGYKLIPPAFGTNWDDNTVADVAGSESAVFLSATVPAAVKGTWIALVSPTASVPPAIVQVQDNVDVTRTAFAISGVVSKLAVPSNTPLASFKMRSTVVLLQSERLPLADLPIDDEVGDQPLTLDGPYLGLKAGQRVVLTGERSDLTGVTAAETLTLKDVTVKAGLTVITFEHAPVHRYVRRTVKVNANVAPATHGETVQEVLGSGDANQAFQRFTLRQPPLTYVPAPTPSGAQTTLSVRVNEVLWHEVPSFYGHEPHERIYITRFAPSGQTQVIFGDGTTGSRLPTGQENVHATYRKGIGLGGLVAANQLTQLLARPLGVRGVTNPVASSGAADPESRDEARRNAPLTVLTFDRVVSLQDYESFARAFSGIDKALATWTWFGEKRGVFLTVAGSQGAEVKDGSDLQKNLIAALRANGDDTVPLLVQTYTPRLFQLGASLKIDPDRQPALVIDAVSRALRAAFSFEARQFGQPVHLSEIYSVMQNVEGVLFVDVTSFHGADDAGVLPRIPAAAPRPGDTGVVAAELLTLDPRPLQLEVLS